MSRTVSRVDSELVPPKTGTRPRAVSTIATPGHARAVASVDANTIVVATSGGEQVEIECKALVLSTGAMGNAPILMRSRDDRIFVTQVFIRR